jgi:ribosomal protein S4E
MYLRWFELKEFIKPSESASTFPVMPSAYKVCGICETEDPDTAEIYAVVDGLESQEKKAFRRGMSKLLKIATTGDDLKIHYNEKQCHVTYKFIHDRTEYKIWRIRTNDLRTLFYYGDGKIILLLDAFPKHKDKLTTAQKLAAKNAVIRYIDGKPIAIIKGKDDENDQE